MLHKLAWRSTVVLTMLGVSYHAYKVIFDNPYSEIIPPYGIVILIFMSTFWAIVFCITPNKYWE